MTTPTADQLADALRAVIAAATSSGVNGSWIADLADAVEDGQHLLRQYDAS